MFNDYFILRYFILTYSDVLYSELLKIISEFEFYFNVYAMIKN